VFDALVLISAGADVAEEPFSAVEQHWDNYQMHFVNEGDTQVLPNSGCAASNQHIAAAGGLKSGVQRCLDPVVDEMERRAPLHFDWGPGVVSEHEYRVMKGWLLAPPAGPVVVTPWATHGAEHIPTHDGGTYPGSPAGKEFIVETFIATFKADHLIPTASGEYPVVELTAINSERILEVLVDPGGVAIKRDREVAHQQSRH
jgi:hypothetical protein